MLFLLLACTPTHDTPAAPVTPAEPIVTPPVTPTPAPIPAPTNGDATGPDTWTAGEVAVERAIAPSTIVAVRTGRHEGFDRLVFELSGPVPGYRLAYVDKPVRQCGSGETVDVKGDGWLEIRIAPSLAHDDKGGATVAGETFPGLPNLLEVQRTCDFEAVTTWVAGVGSPNRYRVFELSEPPRLVVDIKQ